MDNLDSEKLKQRLTDQYDKFAAKAHEAFASHREKSKEALIEAIAATRDELTTLGELSVEQGKRFQHYMKRDLDYISRNIHELGVTTKDRLNPSRIGAGALNSMVGLVHLCSEKLLQLSTKADEAVTCKAGEITGAGTLTCTRCRHAIRAGKSSFIHLCPVCQNDSFTKSY